MDDEMRFNVDMETERLAKAYGPIIEARRRALASFGAVEKYKDSGHDVHASAGWTRCCRLAVQPLHARQASHRGMNKALA